MDLPVMTVTGTPTTLHSATIDQLAASLRGRLLRPNDEGYEAARRVWNGMIDRRPALIARCSGAADVSEAIQFARERDLLVSVRGGGHGVAGSAVCEGGLMIDLAPMNGVRVDPSRRTVRVQGGAVWGAVDRETQVFGLATPSGVVSTTGVAGLALGGGYGYLRRKFGLSCDNLLSADLVTADGKIRVVSAVENDDLYWAIRGGGGNFGVVTSFEFQLHPLGPLVFLGATAYPLANAGPVLRRWRDFVATAPEEISSHVTLWTFPDIPAFPKEARGKPVVVVTGFFAGAADTAEQVLAPLRRLGKPLLDRSGIQPYTAVQSGFDGLFPGGIVKYYAKSTNLDHLEDEVIDELAETMARAPSSTSLINLWHCGGAMGAIDPTATAFWNRQAPYLVSFDPSWTDPADTEKCIAWARRAWSSFRKYSSGGVYVNFAGLGEEGEALVRAAYGGNYDRLVALKTTYDPTNVFRMNQNIRPATEA